MSEISNNTKLDWIPLYFQRLKGSEAWNLPDYQFCWYMKLLIESADSPIPGYLPGSLDKLWRLAGAKSQPYFEKWGGCELVSRLFCRTEIEGQTWIYNKRMLQTIYEQSQKLSHKTRKRSLSLSVSLQSVPDFIDQDLFNKYVEMREKIKKPMTGAAIKMAYRKLEKLQSEGHDPGEVLEQSIFNSWQGLFPVNQQRGVNERETRSVSKADARERRIVENVLKYRTVAAGAVDSAGNSALAVSRNGHDGICGLDGEPEIIAPGKNT